MNEALLQDNTEGSYCGAVLVDYLLCYALLHQQLNLLLQTAQQPLSLTLHLEAIFTRSEWPFYANFIEKYG